MPLLLLYIQFAFKAVFDAQLLKCKVYKKFCKSTSLRNLSCKMYFNDPCYLGLHFRCNLVLTYLYVKIQEDGDRGGKDK